MTRAGLGGSHVGATRALLLVGVIIVSGCVTSEPSLETALVADAGPSPTPGSGLDLSKLTQPVFQMLPKVPAYVAAKVDAIDLYAEVYLPSGDGPWPTILVNSPYFDHGINGATDLMQTFREFYVKRGYAVVLADVRGTGYSEGCMNMMGAKEQADTYDLVEWIAAQKWSDGKVGMYGVSYVGTTPHEAATMAPPHLTTIVTVAGVTNQWRNMYQNGVPYFSRFYPLTYEATEGLPPPGDVSRGPDWAVNAAAGACEQEGAVTHVSPGTYEKGVYDSYWVERNITRGVKNVKASVFYNQGFIDRAVNPMEAVHWFNELDVPKKAVFGQWAHMTPPRKDWTNLTLAWFDHWLKGIDNGIMETPQVEIHTNLDTIRLADEWPPTVVTPLELNLAPGRLLTEVAVEASETYTTDFPRGGPATAVSPPALAAASSGVSDALGDHLEFTTDALESSVYLSGSVHVRLRASVDAENTYFLLSLYEVNETGWWELSEAWMNAHLWAGFDRSTPLEPGEKYTFEFNFEPREWIFEPGDRIGLRIRGHDPRVFPFDKPVTTNTVYFGGADGSAIILPTLPDPVTYERPPNV